MKNVIASLLIAFAAYLITAEVIKMVFWVWFADETIAMMQNHVFAWGGIVALIVFVLSYFIFKSEDEPPNN